MTDKRQADATEQFDQSIIDASYTLYDGLEPGGFRLQDKYYRDFANRTIEVGDLVAYGNPMIDGNFDFPIEVKKIRLDLGLSTSAPNSCSWLLNSEDVGIIGIEANPICLQQLYYCGTSNGYVNSLFLARGKICRFVGYISEIFLKSTILGLDLSDQKNVDINFIETWPGWQTPQGVITIGPQAIQTPEKNFRLFPVLKEVGEINHRYNLIRGAIDNVDGIIMQDFYSSYPSIGCSSLVEGMIEANERPAGNTEDVKNIVNKVFKVPSYSLDTILEHVDWKRFPFIECIKIDVEGKDLDALKSCKKYMDRVVYFRAEAYDDESIIYGIKKRDMVEYMHANNFELIDQYDGDYGFVNKKYKKLANEQGLTPGLRRG